MRFKKGDRITPVDRGRGFEDAVITKIIKKRKKEYYVLKIICGTATIPVGAEINYKLAD